MKANCLDCPLKIHCLAYKKGIVDKIPYQGNKKIIQSIDVAIVVLRKSSKVFIQKRPNSGLMAGLWEFSGGKIHSSESPESALSREIKEELGLTINLLKKIKNIKHFYTSFKVHLHCFESDSFSGTPQLNVAVDSKWVRLSDLKNYAFPSANLKLINFLLNK